MEDKPNYYGISFGSVRYDEDLSQSAKIMHIEITSLSNKEGFCYASNSYFADLYKVKTRTISRWISELQKKGYVEVVIDKLNGNARRIYPIDKNVYTYRQKCHEVTTKMSIPMDKNVQHNNITNNTINNSIDKPKKQYLDYVYLSDDDYTKLKNKFGESFTREMIQRVNDYIGQIGENQARKKFTNHYYTILNWIRRDKDKGITHPIVNASGFDALDRLLDERGDN